MALPDDADRVVAEGAGIALSQPRGHQPRGRIDRSWRIGQNAGVSVAAIVRINTFQARAGGAEGRHGFLASVVAVAEAAAGCLRCKLSVNLEDPARLLTVDTWERAASRRASDCNEEFR